MLHLAGSSVSTNATQLGQLFLQGEKVSADKAAADWFSANFQAFFLRRVQSSSRF